MTRTIVLLLAAFGLAACQGCAAAKAKAPGPSPAAALSPLKDPVLLAEQAAALAEAGDTMRAEQYYLAALAAGGSSKSIVPRFLKTCVESGQLRLAVEYMRPALSADPDNAHLQFLAGAIYAQLGDRAAARESLVRAADALKDNAEVQFAVGTFFRDDLGDRVGSDTYFRRYLEVAPKGEHAAEAKASTMERVR